MINPLEKFKEENNFTYQELAAVCGVCSSTIYKNLNGTNGSMTPAILNTMSEFGYDREQLEEDYQEFRKAKRLELMQNKKPYC